MTEAIKCYRCGYCGTPTDEFGTVLLIPTDGVDYDKAEQTNGDCCGYEGQPEMVQVTRDMAMDAQDMSLEGQWVQW